MKSVCFLFAFLVVLSTLPLQSMSQNVCPGGLTISASQNGVAVPIQTGDVYTNLQGGLPVRFECRAIGECDQYAKMDLSCTTSSDIEMRQRNSGSIINLREPPLDLNSCTCTATAPVSSSGGTTIPPNAPSFVTRMLRVIPAYTVSVQSSVPASSGVVSPKEGNTGFAMFCMITGSAIQITDGIEWRKNGFRINSHNYVLPFLASMRKEDSGNYTCTFFNGQKANSASLLLSVAEGDHPDNAAVIAGSICGAIAVLIIIVVIVVLLVRRWKRNKGDDDYDEEPGKATEQQPEKKENARH